MAVKWNNVAITIIKDAFQKFFCENPIIAIAIAIYCLTLFKELKKNEEQKNMAILYKGLGETLNI